MALGSHFVECHKCYCIYHYTLGSAKEPVIFFLQYRVLWRSWKLWTILRRKVQQQMWPVPGMWCIFSSIFPIFLSVLCKLQHELHPPLYSTYCLYKNQSWHSVIKNKIKFFTRWMLLRAHKNNYSFLGISENRIKFLTWRVFIKESVMQCEGCSFLSLQHLICFSTHKQTTLP